MLAFEENLHIIKRDFDCSCRGCSTEVGVVNAHIVFGLFALYVAAISLWMVLVGQQDTVLALLRQFWGRTIGHALYFVARVALPILICVIFLGWGVRQYDATIAFHDSDPFSCFFSTGADANLETISTLIFKHLADDII